MELCSDAFRSLLFLLLGVLSVCFDFWTASTILNSYSQVEKGRAEARGS